MQYFSLVAGIALSLINKYGLANSVRPSIISYQSIFVCELNDTETCPADDYISCNCVAASVLFRPLLDCRRLARL